ncbi:hypothetical protein LNQ49_15705 [Flavobacterium sp. F-65]|uniref:Substrate import-associated zinc metallohydrolase lipoprotein n=1 Tax=Flavobacterium pisciphilum TaxID=2893755 RepID=A0ABS8MW82_9FLAO|nr:hypothetical protein [Flavobacterium sp. F-65]MCC9073025.1 hypothetical protein [Flavobacterium sp. F-65]
MNKFLSILALIGVFSLLLLSSCATEDYINEKPIDPTIVNQAKYYFEKNSIELKNNIYFLGNPDWQKGIFVNDTLLVLLISEDPIFIKDVNKDIEFGYLKSSLVITKNKYDNGFDYNLKVSFYSDINTFIIKRYHLYDNKNVLISDNGKKPRKKNKNQSITSKTSCVHWGTFLIREGGQDILLRDWWECTGTVDDDEQAPPDGGGSGGEVLTKAQLIEDYIYDAKLDPCPKAILAQLKNATNCDIANILTKLGANSVYSVTISSGDAGMVPAFSKAVSPNNYEIVMNNERYTSSTQLYKAANLVHELAHVFFMSLVDDYNSSQNPNVFNEFPVLFQKYVDTKYPGGKENAQHEEMADNYVDAIGATLQEFQTGVAVPYGKKPLQVYVDLAWGGLRDAPIFGKKFPKGSAERLRIENRLASEQTGNTVGTGTPQQQNTIGKPCK